jgi:PDZ domain-containing protein
VTIPPDSVPTADVPPVVDDPPFDESGSATVDVTPDEADRSSRRRGRWGLLAGIFVVLAASVAAALLIRLPYYLIEPGSVRPAEQRIDVKGAPAYRTKGKVLFTTVFLVRATPATWLQSKIDHTIEIVPEKALYPHGTKEGEQQNRADMDVSKLVATKNALTFLGYDAKFTGDGARVAALSATSPSQGKLAAGDVITGVAGTPVALPSDIGRALAGREPGQSVPVTYRRKNANAATEVTLGAAPDDARRPVLGVQVVATDPRVDSPVTVDVDSGTVSGPSAGLAWTLAIIDRMTPGSLTRGKDVAVTGEMLPDGTVGQIGGIAQKVAAVRRAGIRTFLFPASTPAKDRAAMKKVAGDAVRLEPVGTLSDAVRVLDPALAAQHR